MPVTDLLDLVWKRAAAEAGGDLSHPSVIQAVGMCAFCTLCDALEHHDAAAVQEILAWGGRFRAVALQAGREWFGDNALATEFQALADEVAGRAGGRVDLAGDGRLTPAELERLLKEYMS